MRKRSLANKVVSLSMATLMCLTSVTPTIAAEEAENPVSTEQEADSSAKADSSKTVKVTYDDKDDSKKTSVDNKEETDKAEESSEDKEEAKNTDKTEESEDSEEETEGDKESSDEETDSKSDEESEEEADEEADEETNEEESEEKSDEENTEDAESENDAEESDESEDAENEDSENEEDEEDAETVKSLTWDGGNIVVSASLADGTEFPVGSALVVSTANEDPDSYKGMFADADEDENPVINIVRFNVSYTNEEGEEWDAGNANYTVTFNDASDMAEALAEGSVTIGMYDNAGNAISGASGSGSGISFAFSTDEESFFTAVVMNDTEDEEAESDEEEKTETEDGTFAFSDAAVNVSGSGIYVDNSNGTLSGTVAFDLSAQKTGDEDAEVTIVNEAVSFPEGVIVPGDVYTDGASVYAGGNVLFQLESGSLATITDAGAAGNTVYMTVQADQAGDVGDASIVMYADGLAVGTETETLYHPIDSADEAAKEVTADDEFLTESEAQNVEEDTLALKVTKTSFAVNDGDSIEMTAAMDLTSKDGDEISLSAGNSVTISGAEDSFETDEVLVLYEPLYDGKQYGKNHFDEDYSSGAFILKASTLEQDPIWGPGWTPVSYGTEATPSGMHIATNTEKDESVYKIWKNGAVYNNKLYDVKVYSWSNSSRYGANMVGFGNAWQECRDPDTNEVLWEKDTTFASEFRHTRVFEEYHIIDPDTGEEIEWKGIIKFTDIDGGRQTETGTADEGYHFSYEDGVWTTFDQQLKIETDDEGLWYMGKVDAENTDPNMMIYVQTKTSPGNPLSIIYNCPLGLFSAVNHESVSIDFRLTSDSDVPSALKEDGGRIISGDLKSWDYYAKYGMYTVPEVHEYPGYTVEGWGSEDNFDNPSAEDNYIPGNEIPVGDALTYYVRYKAITGNVEIEKTVENSPTTSRAGWTFTLSGTSVAGDQISLTATTDASGIARFDNVPIGTYTVTETVDGRVWTVSGNPQTVTVSDGQTAYLEYTNTYNTVNITVNNIVQDPTGMHDDPDNFYYKIKGTTYEGYPYNDAGSTTNGGTLVFEGVPAGEYTITEIGTPESPNQLKPYWDVQPVSQNVSVTNQDAEVDFLNILKTGGARVAKKITDPSRTVTNAAGFVFSLTGKADIGDTIDLTAETDAQGNASFDGIPVGTYTIKEIGTPDSPDSIPAWWRSNPQEKSVAVKYNETVTFEVENVFLTGNVKVKKTIDGDNRKPEGFEFVLEGTSNSGARVSMTVKTDANGIASFNNIPVGTYTITETVNNKVWDVSENPMTVTVEAEKTVEKEVVNTFRKADVIVTNDVIDPTDKHTSPEDFHYEIVGKTYEGKEIRIPGSTDKDGNLVFEDVPAGEYTVIEKGTPESPDKVPDWWEVDPEKHNIIVETEDQEVPFTNTLKTGSLSIKKKVNDASNSFEDLSGFVFALTGKAAIGDEINLEVATDKDGNASFENIPIGTFTLNEVGTPDSQDKFPDWWETDAVDKKVTIEYNETAEFEVTNTFKTGTVKAKKIVADSTVLPEGFEFELEGKSASGLEIKKNAATDADGIVVFEGIPVGKYTLTELANENVWDIAEKTNDIEVAYNETAEVEVTNTYKRGSVKVTKVVADADVPLEGFEFELNGTANDGTAIHEVSKTNAEGVALFEKIPVGKYTLTENADEKVWDIADKSTELDVEYKETKEITVTNTYKRGSVKVIKALEGTKASLEGFEFTLDGKAADGTAVHEVAKTNKDGVILFEKIPVGKYTLTENADEKVWNISEKTIDVEVEYKNTKEIHVTNTYKRGSLKVTKEVVGPKKGKKGFEFELTGKANDGSTLHETGTTNEKGILVFEDLPVGKYTLKELVNDKVWEVSEKTMDVEITPDKTKEVKITNTFKTGSVEIKKTVDNKSYSLEGFIFTLKGKAYSGDEVNLTGATDKNGKLSFVDIPVGQYTVTEIGCKEFPEEINRLWSPDPKSQDVVVEYGKTAKISVKNILNLHDVKVRKVDKNGALIGGATLQILDKDGRLQAEWTSEAGKESIQKLVPGTYVLHEKTAPANFKTAADIKFVVTHDGKLEVGGKKAEAIVMVDEAATVPNNNNGNPGNNGGTPSSGGTPAVSTPQTGDNFNTPLACGIAAAVVLLLAAGYVLIRKPKKKHN